MTVLASTWISGYVAVNIYVIDTDGQTATSDNKELISRGISLTSSVIALSFSLLLGLHNFSVSIVVFTQFIRPIRTSDG